MFCPNCGKELPEGSRFCPACGKETTTAPASTPVKPPSTVTLNTKTLLVIAAAVIVVLLAVLVFRPGQGKAPAPAPGAAQTEEPTPTPDPAAALVGTWTNKEGVGLKFTEDGTLKLSGLGLDLGGDTFSYEVSGDNTLTLTATVGGILSAGKDVPYGLMGDTLYIEIGGLELTLTRK